MYLYAENQGLVGLLQFLLPHLNLFGSLLLFLEFSYVINRSLQNGSLVPAHLPNIVTKQEVNIIYVNITN